MPSGTEQTNKESGSQEREKPIRIGSPVLAFFKDT